METLNVKSVIFPTDEIKERVEFLKNYCRKANAKGFVLGISGGQDSTLAGKLAQLACKKLRNEGYNATFIAVRLPYGIQKDEADAQLAIKFIQPDATELFDIKEPVDAIQTVYNKTSLKQHLSDFHKGNVKARMRMIGQYAIGGENGLLVIGTDHAAEAVTGFFTKFGDGGADILPLSGLTKRQGKALLKELGCPENLYLKAPTADLLDDKPQRADENELGITYELLDDYLEGKTVPDEVAIKIENRFIVTEHKRKPPVTMFDTWWK